MTTYIAEVRRTSSDIFPYEYLKTFTTLEELLEFQKEMNQELIIADSNEEGHDFYIEIYNAYRE